MGTTAYGNARRERNQRIREAAFYAAAAAVEWVEELDAVNRDGVEQSSLAEFVERQQKLIEAARRYSEECRS